MTIKDLEPKIVWDNFYGLTRVPRPSKHEEKVQQYLLDWGKARGIEVFRDDTGNIIFTDIGIFQCNNLRFLFRNHSVGHF